MMAKKPDVSLIEEPNSDWVGLSSRMYDRSTRNVATPITVHATVVNKETLIISVDDYGPTVREAGSNNVIELEYCDGVLYLSVIEHGRVMSCVELRGKLKANLAQKANVKIAARDPSQLMTIKEVAEELNVSRSHLYMEIKRGKLPFRRLGKCIRISRDDLDVYRQ